MYDEGFPWVKFSILTVPLVIMMFYMADGLKWKILFALCVPIGVGLALSGKSLNPHKKRGGY